VGIQGEDQIGILQLLCEIKQVPEEIIGKVALIPFQIHDLEVRGEDKKLP
jgi:hypothetical protein